MPTVVTVERFNLTIAVSTRDMSANLTQGQTIANCIVFITSEVDETAEAFANRRLIRARLASGPDRVIVERGSNGATGPEVVAVTVIEFDPADVDVQSGTVTADNSPITASLMAVDLSKTFAVTSLQGNQLSSDNGPDEMSYECDLPSTTQIRFRSFDTLHDDVDIQWYTAEALGGAWTVQQVSWSLISALTDDVSITAVDLSRTFHVGTYRTDSGADSAPDVCTATTALTSTTNLRATAPSTTADERTGTVFVVECDATIAAVQRGNVTLSNAGGGIADVSQTAAITAVDLTRSQVWLGSGWMGFSSGGRNTSGASGNTEAMCRAVFNSTTQIEVFARGLPAGTDTDAQYEVIEWLEGSMPGPVGDDDPIDVCVPCIAIPGGGPISLAC